MVVVVADNDDNYNKVDDNNRPSLEKLNLVNFIFTQFDIVVNE